MSTDTVSLEDLLHSLRDLVKVLRRPPMDAELLPARDAARLSGISTASWHRAVAAGKAPLPIRINGSVRWQKSVLLSWIEQGCPPRATATK